MTARTKTRKAQRSVADLLTAKERRDFELMCAELDLESTVSAAAQQLAVVASEHFRRGGDDPSKRIAVRVEAARALMRAVRFEKATDEWLHHGATRAPSDS